MLFFRRESIDGTADDAVKFLKNNGVRDGSHRQLHSPRHGLVPVAANGRDPPKQGAKYVPLTGKDDIQKELDVNGKAFITLWGDDKYMESTSYAHNASYGLTTGSCLGLMSRQVIFCLSSRERPVTHGVWPRGKMREPREGSNETQTAVPVSWFSGWVYSSQVWPEINTDTAAACAPASLVLGRTTAGNSKLKEYPPPL